MVCRDRRMGSRVDFNNGIVRYVVIAVWDHVSIPLKEVVRYQLCLAVYVVSLIARVSSSG